MIVFNNLRNLYIEGIPNLQTSVINVSIGLGLTINGFRVYSIGLSLIIKKNKNKPNFKLITNEDTIKLY